MTEKEYYGRFFPVLKQGEACLKRLAAAYPADQSGDGIQPLLYVKTRIKTPESMKEKLERRGLLTDCATALREVHDALGMRMICSFGEEVYRMADWLYRRPEIQIVEEKDYIAYPKPNGYRSLHLILQFTQRELSGIYAEVQIRTIATDFWAVLEHQMKYKQNVPHESVIQEELKRCADEIASVDLSMQTLRDILRSDDWNRE